MKRASSAIQQGVPGSPYLGIPRKLLDAVVHVSAVEHVKRCTGVLVDARFVLTAAHCSSEATDLIVSFGQAAEAPLSRRAVRRQLAHIALDLVLLELEQPMVDIAPLPMLTRRDDLPSTGQLVEVAGYGLTEDAVIGTRFVAVEEISAVLETSFEVSGAGLSGACAGDSGGPLLGRDAAGRAGVLGVLEGGSASCRGTDRYTRLDVGASWLSVHVALDGAAPGECPEFGADGRCFGSTAVWCEAGSERRERCGGRATCGWSATARGYRCVTADPCDRLSDLGSCIADSAVRCARGRLVSSPCADCDAICARSPKTGMVGCL